MALFEHFRQVPTDTHDFSKEVAFRQKAWYNGRVNRTRTIRPLRSLRALALLLALICLGISGGTTLVHTEDLGQLQTFHAGRSALAHAVDGSDGSCLACQWEVSTYNPHVPAVPVVRLPLVWMPFPASSSETLAPRPFDHTSPRAPPRAS